MSSIIYLLLMSAKNTLLELKKKPAKLIMYIFIIVLIVSLTFISTITKQENAVYADIIYLKAIFFAFMMLFVGITLVKSLASGDTFFEMSDVNLMFVAPISSKKILIYGLIRMTKMAFWAGFFLLFQSSSLGSLFGVGFDGLLVLLFCFMLGIVLLEIICLIIYSVTNGNSRRKLAVKVITALIFLPSIIYFLIEYTKTGNIAEAFNKLINSPLIDWLPVSGWAAKGAVSIITGSTANGLLFIGLMAASCVILTIYILVSNSDYYEDVLVATETSFEKKRAVAEGNINATTSSTRNIKVVATGIKGTGASALLGKHIRESMRENRLKIISTPSIVIIAIAVIVSLFMRGSEDASIIMFMQILMWTQIYMIGAGRGLKELYSHYIYMIPESPFSKTVWSNLEVVFKTLIESIFVFGISGIIIGEGVLVIISTIITYSLFSLLLLGINYLSMRWTDADISAGLLILIYSIAVVIVMLPGVIPALIVGFSVGGRLGIYAGLGILSAWELIASLICFYMSKSVLHNCYMPTAGNKK